MQQLYGQGEGIIILLHGGAGGQDPRGSAAIKKATDALRAITQKALAQLADGRVPLDVATWCIEAMEDDPQFNAGYGSALQADGVARLTAALMDGQTSTFSGVMGCTHLVHPSRIARQLQTREARVLGDPGCQLMARELGLPVSSPVTPKRAEAWLKKVPPPETGYDTVGAVIRSASGALVAASSTGGRGFEYPGRLSDSATVAGTYASPYAAICATGVGEQIIDDALAARIETRRRDGMALEQASRAAFAEATAHQRHYGWIAADREGHWGVAHVTPSMSYFVASSIQGELTASDRTL